MKPQSRFAAIMFTDIVGYSALTHEDEALSLALLQKHRQLLRPLFPDHGGREVKTTGDGFLVEFENTLQAVRCAVAMQQTLRDRNHTAPEREQTQIRIGIHLDDIQELDGDIYGDGVNIAARIEPLAEAGGICLSENVARKIMDRFEQPLISLGIPELKNIKLPLEVFRVALPWLERAPHAVAQRRTDPENATNSVVVLPFVNMSSDPENEYFSDGLTEELTNVLTTVKRLKVISRSSAFTFKGRSIPLQQVGRQLRVDNVLEGSVRKAGNRIRVTAQLIQVADDTHLWSQSYDRQLDDIFEIQDDISRKIVETLKVKLFRSDAHELAAPRSKNIRAYELYLRGAHLAKLHEKEAFLKADRYLERSLREDPSFPPTYVEWAHCYFIREELGYLKPGEGFSQARQLLEKALEIDPEYPRIYWMLGVLAHYDWNWEGQERNFSKAIELLPGDPHVLGWYGFLQVTLGNFERGLNHLDRALELDPLFALLNLAFGRCLRFARQDERALEYLQRALDLNPNTVFAHLHMAYIWYGRGKFERALSLFESELEVSQLPFVKVYIEGTKRAMGRKHDLPALLRRIEGDPDPRVRPPTTLSAGHLLLGDHERALDWLERGLEERDRWMVYIKGEPLIDPLRGDPRFAALLERMGLSS